MGFGQQIGQMGLGVADSAIGMGMGLLLGKINDKRQLKQQQKLQDMQMQGNLQMLKAQEEKELRMWKNTSYEAQKEQMKLAGLNPGLMYGMGGGGGQTVGGSGGGVSGGHAPAGGGEAVQMAGMGLQMGMQKAQLENVQAQTELTKAQAEKTKGVDTEKTKTEITDLTQGIENKKLAGELTKVQTRIAGLDEQLKDRTMEDSVRAVGWAAEKVMQEMTDLRYTNNINEETWKTKVAQAKAELAGTWLNNALIKETTGLTQDKRTEIVNGIKQKWLDMERTGISMKVDERSKEWQMFINDVQQSSGLPLEILREAFDGIIRVGGEHRRGYSEGWKDANRK